MRRTIVKIGSLLLALSLISAGCKSTALNDEAQSEKQQVQGGVDKRADAIDKMSKPSSSGSN